MLRVRPSLIFDPNPTRRVSLEKYTTSSFLTISYEARATPRACRKHALACLQSNIYSRCSRNNTPAGAPCAWLYVLCRLLTLSRSEQSTLYLDDEINRALSEFSEGENEDIRSED